MWLSSSSPSTGAVSEERLIEYEDTGTIRSPVGHNLARNSAVG